MKEVRQDQVTRPGSQCRPVREDGRVVGSGPAGRAAGGIRNMERETGTSGTRGTCKADGRGPCSWAAG